MDNRSFTITAHFGATTVTAYGSTLEGALAAFREQAEARIAELVAERMRLCAAIEATDR